MKPYLKLLCDVRDHGVERGDRTGTGARSVFGRQLRFDLQRGFPAITTKFLHFRSIIHELLWFLRGATFTWIANRFGRFGPELTTWCPATFYGPTQQHRARSASHGKRPPIHRRKASDKP